MFGYGLILCVFVFFGRSEASAIPMWEYLSKQEKMSFLYSMFANQVESFCDSSNMKNCNQELLKYGLDKLKNLPEEYMDSMDPYQRGANTIIWDAMMAGHKMANEVPKMRSTTSAKPNSYEDGSFSDFGSQSAASARIDNVVRVLPPKGFLKQYETQQRYTYPHNVVSYLNTFNIPQKKGAYTRFQEQYSSTTTTTEETPLEDPYEEGMYDEAPLTGPMVVKVYPMVPPSKTTTLFPWMRI
ncbi:rhythmically expressed gene 5 [Leptinotarsa decemlineata]|uniref:rhythmically expressed gene 5 n=1 Tax=Leptinotarsa decemlineata TaxID=7539 RepID=UPI003D30B764